MVSQLVEVPLVGGVNERVDYRKLPLGQLVAGENVQILKSGRYDKRQGFTALSMGSVGTIASLAARDKQLLACEMRQLWAFSEGGGTAAWSNVDQLPEYTASRHEVSQNTGENIDGTVAYMSERNALCYTWTATDSFLGSYGRIWAVVVDASTGALLVRPTELTSTANGNNPRIVCVDDTFVVTWRAQTGAVRASTLSSALSSWTSATNLVTDGQGGAGLFAYDVVPVDGGTTFVLVYANNGGTASPITAVIYTSALSVAVGPTSYDTLAPRSILNLSVSADATNTWIVATYDTGAVWRFVGILAATTTLTQTVAHTIMLNLATGKSATNCSVLALSGSTAWVNVYEGIDLLSYTAVVSSAFAFVGSSSRTQRRMILMSRPWLANGRTYAVVRPYDSGSDNVQPTLFVADMGSHDTATATLQPRPVCMLAPRTASTGFGRTSNSLSAAVADGDGNIRIVGATSPGPISQRVTVIGYSLTTEAPRQSAELGGLLYFSGGMPSWYDGTRVGEVGFPLQAEFAAAATVSNGAGALDTSATYTYAMIYVDFDAVGNIHRSAPYVDSAVMGVADDTVALYPLYLNWTTREDAAHRFNKPAIQLYRSEGNGTDLRRLSPEVAYPTGATASSSGTMQNDPASRLLTYTDLVADSAIASNPLIYTSGGTLDSVNPPSARLVCVHRGRVWLAGLPDARDVWASTKYVPGEAVWFNEGLTHRTDFDVTAIASMDDKFLLFGEDRIAFISGDGPNDAGLQSDWSEPVHVLTTVGCVDARSVVVTPVGVMFQSRVGLSLISRGLEVIPDFGAPMEAMLSTYPTVVYAVLVPGKTEVRFGVQNAAGSAGRELRYDFQEKIWLTARYLPGGTDRIPVGAVAVDGSYYWASSANVAYKESDATWLDGSTFVPMTLEFAPLQAAGPQGYEGIRSVQWLWDRYTHADLTITALVDGEETAGGSTFTQTLAHTTIAAMSSVAASASSQFAIEKSFGPTGLPVKCSSVRVRFTDATPTSGTVGTGRGGAFVSVIFDMFPKGKGGRQLPATNRI